MFSEPVGRHPTLAAAFLGPFMKLAAVQPGERVLDIAPVGGESAVAAAIRARGRGEVLSVGSSPEALEAVARAARDAGVTTIRTATMDPERLDLGDAYWDVATCHFGLSDIADPEQAFMEMRRVLRPAGRVAVSVFAERGRCALATIFLDVVGTHRPAASAEQNARFHIAESGRLGGLLADVGFAEAVPERPVARIPFRDVDDYWDFVTASTCFGGIAAPLSPDAVNECKAEIARRTRLYGRGDGIELRLEALVLAAVK